MAGLDPAIQRRRKNGFRTKARLDQSERWTMPRHQELDVIAKKSRARPASPRPRPTSPVNGAGGKTGCRDDSGAPRLVPGRHKFFYTRLSDGSAAKLARRRLQLLLPGLVVFPIANGARDHAHVTAFQSGFRRAGGIVARRGATGLRPGPGRSLAGRQRHLRQPAPPQLRSIAPPRPIANPRLPVRRHRPAPSCCGWTASPIPRCWSACPWPGRPTRTPATLPRPL